MTEERSRENFKKVVIKQNIGEISAVIHKGTKGVVVAFHGFESFKDSPKYILMGEEFQRRGYTFIRFDFRGCGETPGDKYDLEGRISDAISVYNYAKKLSDRIYFIGSSLGGAIAILLGEHAMGVVALCPPFTDIGEYKMVSALSKNPPILIIHGDKDEVVPIEEGKKIFELARPPKEFFEVTNGDHRFSDPEHLKTVIQKAVEFIEKIGRQVKM